MHGAKIFAVILALLLCLEVLAMRAIIPGSEVVVDIVGAPEDFSTATEEIYFASFARPAIISPEENRQMLLSAIEALYREDRPYHIEPAYTVTDQEYEWLVRLLFLEAGYCSLETKISIASLVFNRLKSNIWGDTLEQVLFAPNQFRTRKTIERCIPYTLKKYPYYEKTSKFIRAWDECYQALDYVLEWGSILPDYVMFYRTNYHFRWRGYRGYTVIENVYFGYLETHKKMLG